MFARDGIIIKRLPVAATGVGVEEAADRQQGPAPQRFGIRYIPAKAAGDRIPGRELVDRGVGGNAGFVKEIVRELAAVEGAVVVVDVEVAGVRPALFCK